MVLSVLGINLQPVLAVGGASGIIIGLATQQLLGNAVTGLSLFLSRPFVKGESVTLQQGGVAVGGGGGHWVACALACALWQRSFNPPPALVPHQLAAGQPCTACKAGTSEQTCGPAPLQAAPS
jgi:hypothetical protein